MNCRRARARAAAGAAGASSCPTATASDSGSSTCHRTRASASASIVGRRRITKPTIERGSGSGFRGKAFSGCNAAPPPARQLADIMGPRRFGDCDACASDRPGLDHLPEAERSAHDSSRPGNPPFYRARCIRSQRVLVSIAYPLLCLGCNVLRSAFCGLCSTSAVSHSPSHHLVVHIICSYLSSNFAGSPPPSPPYHYAFFSVFSST